MKFKVGDRVKLNAEGHETSAECAKLYLERDRRYVNEKATVVFVGASGNTCMLLFDGANRETWHIDFIEKVE